MTIGSGAGTSSSYLNPKMIVKQAGKKIMMDIINIKREYTQVFPEYRLREYEAL